MVEVERVTGVVGEMVKKTKIRYMRGMEAICWEIRPGGRGRNYGS